MEKINIAELLKDCPKGMELDCTILNDVTLDSVDIDGTYPIIIATKSGYLTSLTKYGQQVDIEDAKCVIFPKGKTTWEGFQRPFKDGDVLYVRTANQWICIYKEGGEKENVCHRYVAVASLTFVHDGSALCHRNNIKEIRLATDEEKQKLFDAIKDNGYRWNAETKTLESLVGPKFNIGDSITHLKLNHVVYTVTRITDTHYIVKSDGIYAYEYHIPISSQDYYEKVRLKFNYNTLVPFESKVLIRHDKEDKWMPSFWGYKTDNGYITTFGWWKYCIPYKGNEHLLGTTDDCADWFKTWE